MNKTTLFFAFLLLPFGIFSQNGGKNIYEFLNLGSSARVVALGGNQVALNDTGPDYAFYNPAALNANLNQKIALNYVNYISDINYGYAAYNRHYKNTGSFSLAMHYVNYGKFARANEFGVKNGNFKAADYALVLSYGRELSPCFKIGASLKPIYSSLEKYSSFGLAADLAIIYDSPNELFRASFVARNFGYQIKAYYGSHREDLPYNIAIGMSTKLKHAPFRFAVTYQHLEEFDLSYVSDLNKSQSESTSDKTNFTDKFAKHLILGTEFLPHENFSIRLGYNFKRRQELKIEGKSSTVGFSWGFGLKVSRFRINFASAKYHLAGSSTHFSISTRLSDFSF